MLDTCTKTQTDWLTERQTERSIHPISPKNVHSKTVEQLDLLWDNHSHKVVILLFLGILNKTLLNFLSVFSDFIEKVSFLLWLVFFRVFQGFIHTDCYSCSPFIFISVWKYPCLQICHNLYIHWNTWVL